MQVIGSVFSRGGRDGDFNWMIDRPEYADALFIFNDNEEQFRAHCDNPRDAYGCSSGGGNAAIRPYQCKEPPRAAGIPTGVDGKGYGKLTGEVRAVIDRAIANIRGLIASGRYSRVIYSAADASGQLGTGIFKVATDVKQYIVEQLQSLWKEEKSHGT